MANILVTLVALAVIGLLFALDPGGAIAGSCVLRTSRLRQTGSVRESVPTSNHESGKRWNETKVRNRQSLTSAHWKPRDSVVSLAAQPHL